MVNIMFVMMAIYWNFLIQNTWCRNWVKLRVMKVGLNYTQYVLTNVHFCSSQFQR